MLSASEEVETGDRGASIDMCETRLSFAVADDFSL